MLSSSEPIFAVADVPQTVRYYREVLGFESEWFWGEPPTFGGVRWGQIQVMFCLQPELSAHIRGHEHWFRVEDVQSLYERHRSAGATIVDELANRPWGGCEYILRDLNGYHLRFSGPEKYEKPKTATDSLPPHIELTVGKANIDDYLRLTELVGWNKDESTMRRALDYSIFCVMATDTRSGRVVGMLRVCGDGRQYTIWDVMVEPDCQGQRIGSALMEVAMAELQRVGVKNAFVGLFTGKPAFYERFGFVLEGGMHRPL